jgi:hypothetical protein
MINTIPAAKRIKPTYPRKANSGGGSRTNSKMK